MAIEGVPIDFTKKYKLKNGCWEVISFKVNDNVDYPLSAIFKDIVMDYTYDGFYYTTREEDGLNLILIEEEDKPMKVNFKVFKEIKKEEKSRDVYFRLDQFSGGEIVLIAVSETGDLISNILRIDLQGNIVRIKKIEPTLGLRLDAEGRVLIKN